MRQAKKGTTPLPTREGQEGGYPFLYHVAQDLIARFGNNLSEVTIVFPGKRAQLYMNSFLSHIAQGPVWAPRFVTIDELFQQFSPYTPSDNIRNVCTLYDIYARLASEPQSPDDFYSWGEILMNDFSDIDKHMADADSLFANGADLAALEQNVDYLSEAQIGALRQFFTNFSPDRQTEIKRRFMQLWRIMPQMYHQLKERLKQDGLLYKGGLYRDVVEKIKQEAAQPSCTKAATGLTGNPALTYCFVGFNVLDEVEQHLFAALQERRQALFYWDYDVYYAGPDSDHEAGLFLRQNLKQFPNALPADIFDNLMSPDKRIHYIATTTDNAQVRYLPEWLAQCGPHSAVVLCDEALMRPALHAIPDGAEVNLTMGYPLTDTAVHGYLSALFDLQLEGYDSELRRFRPTALERAEGNPFFATFPQELRPLTHQTDNLALVDWLIAAIESLGRQLSTTDMADHLRPLYAEATFQLYQVLSQFRWVLTDGILRVKPTTLRRLVRQALQTTSIPFHGEMDHGIQVMGLLEARNLDFRHLIMLSVGEGIIPRRTTDTSLIPYILRAHFGLDTTERQDAVYAYSFYRLLQRAQDVTLVYNNNSSGASQREPSRFLRQLLVETHLDIDRRVHTPSATTALPAPITVAKDARIMHLLHQKTYLSPTAINQYIECPLRFYYQQVARLRIPERPQDGINAPLFGTIFHDACEIFYQRLCQTTGRNEVQHADLAPLVGDRHTLGTIVDQAIERQIEGVSRHYTGVNMIIRDVVLQLLQQLLRWDMAHTPFTLYAMEREVTMPLSVPTPQGDIQITVGGRIDRMDIMPVGGQPTLRVIDYKTGRAKTPPRDIEALFDGDANNAHAYYLQTCLYAIIMSRQQQLPVSPGLFYVLSATDPTGYDPILRLNREPIADIRPLAADYLDQLRRILAELFDPTVPFCQTNDAQKHCSLCDFRLLCNK